MTKNRNNKFPVLTTQMLRQSPSSRRSRGAQCSCKMFSWRFDYAQNFIRTPLATFNAAGSKNGSPARLTSSLGRFIFRAGI